MKIPFFFFFFLLFVSFVLANPLEDQKKLEIKKHMRSVFDYLATPKSSFLGKILSKQIKNQNVYEKFMNFHKSAKENNRTVLQHAFNTYLEENNIVKESWTCYECKKYTQYLQGLDNSTLVKYGEKFIIWFCSKILDPSVCAGAVNEYADFVVTNYLAKLLDPQILCGKIGLCPKSYIPLYFEEYKKEVLADKPARNVPTPKKKEIIKVLHLADAHIDFEYEEGSNAFCNEPFCCRGENGLAPSPDKAAQYWGSLSTCDIPIRTAEQAFINMAELNPDIILWTGDNISHDIWHQAAFNQTRPTKYLTSLFKKYFNNATLYPIFGNHECFPADQFDVFSTDETFWLKNETSEYWQNYLDESSYNSLRQNGFYSSYNSRFNLRIIVLNTQTCDTVNFFLIKNPTDPNNILTWLRNELYIAEKNNQSAYIIGHIPPANSYCLSEWAQRYTVLMERFENVVKGQFFGHTHQDHYESMRSLVDGKVVGTVFIAPSLTTFSNQNPGFRIFEVDKETMLPTNILQYRLNLTKVNTEFVNASRINWDLAYDFLSEYNVTDLTPQSLYNLALTFESNAEFRHKFLYNLFSGGTVMTPSDYDTGYNIRYYGCKLLHTIFTEFSKCLGTYLVEDSNDVLFTILQNLDGEWFTLKPILEEGLSLEVNPAVVEEKI